MKKLMFLTMMFGLMIVLTGSVSAQNKGKGLVYGFSDANGGGNGRDSYAPKFGDAVRIAEHTPRNTDAEVGFVSGQKMDIVMFIQGKRISGVRMEGVPQDLRNLMMNKTTKISGLTSETAPLKRGDTVTIQSQPAKGGGMDVTFSFFRGGKSFNSISFVVK